MQNLPISDDQIIAQERRGFRRAMAALPIAAVVLFGFAALGLWAFETGLMSPWLTQASFAGFIVGLAGTITIVVLLKYVAAKPKQAKDERILRKQIDDYHRRAQYLYLLLIAIVLFEAWMMVTGHLPAPGRDLQAWVTPAAFAFFILCVGALVVFGPGFVRRSYRRALNDELTRAMRGRAAILGYLLAILFLAAAYLIGLYRPEWNIWILPPAMAGAVTLPALYFLIQQWRAGRDE